jgi:dihydroorotase
MNLEIEFDERALKNNMNWGYRLKDYLDVFEQNNVFDSLKVAYYQGGDAFYRLSQSKEPSDIELHKKLIEIISDK